MSRSWVWCLCQLFARDIGTVYLQIICVVCLVLPQLLLFHSMSSCHLYPAWEKAHSQCCKCSVSCVYQQRNKAGLSGRNLGLFWSQDVHLDWLPPQPPTAPGTAVGTFLQAEVGESLWFPGSFQGVFFNTKQVMMYSPLIHVQGPCVAPSACENMDFCSSGKNLCTLSCQAVRKAESYNVSSAFP